MKISCIDIQRGSIITKSEEKSDALIPLDQYIEFLEEIGCFKSDRTLSKIYPERFSLKKEKTLTLRIQVIYYLLEYKQL